VLRTGCRGNYYSGDQIKGSKMDMVHVAGMGEIRTTNKMLVRKCERKKELGRSRCR
jgi:hypothetical protein